MTNIEMETMAAIKQAACEYICSKQEQQRFTAAMHYATSLMNSNWYDGTMEQSIDAGIEFADELIKRLKK